jgi:hypothetical protein
MTKQLSTAVQAVLNSYWGEGYFEASELPSRLAAALRAAVDQVVPEEGKECECFTNEAIRLNRMGVRAEFRAIADELEGQ